MMTEAQKCQKWGSIIGKVASKSDPTKVYDVREKRGIFTCNCKGFIFNKRCKHVAAWNLDKAAKEWKAKVIKPQPFADSLIAVIEKRLNLEFPNISRSNTTASLIALDVRVFLNAPELDPTIPDKPAAPKPIRLILIED